jgi:ribonuclease R
MKSIKKNLKDSDECGRILLKFFKSNSKVGYRLKQIFKIFKLKDTVEKDLFKQNLHDLVQKKQIDQIDKEKYIAAKSYKSLIGRVDYVNPNYAYIIPDDASSADIRIQSHNLLGSLDKDLVKVSVVDFDSKRPSGKVVEIIERARKFHVCVLKIDDKLAYAVPVDRHMYHNILLPKVPDEAKDGYKITVAITSWDKNRSQPTGVVQSVLGLSGVHDVEMHAIMAEFDLPSHFLKEVELEAGAIKDGISNYDISTRRDFRAITTFTIDPKDAKDFDDALSFHTLPNGNYEIGIHIADVSHYVKENTLLNEEAYNRGCSVYLVDRTIPMLPENLCNQLCSLRPNEDKLTFSAVFEINKEGNIINDWFGETIINSNKRFVYEEAQKIMDDREGIYNAELQELNKIAKILRQRRIDNGAIEFEQAEVVFELDSNGKPISIVPKQTCDTHRLVEEFMVLANNRVAEYISKTSVNSGLVYRVHAEPSLDKLNDFYTFMGQLGYLPKTVQKSSTCVTINSIIKNIHGKPEELIVQTLAIRTMARALYTYKEQEHFGLGLDHYAHFTSPIRRYPDIMVHRVLKNVLKKNLIMPDIANVDLQCKHLSNREQVAASAERASVRYKQVEFVSTLQGKIHKGIIGSITEWGIYIELLHIRCEGMVKISDMQDDYYVFSKQTFSITGRKTKNQYKVGQVVDISIQNCDFINRTITLKLEKASI